MITVETIKDNFKGALITSVKPARKNSYGKYMSHRNDEEIILVSQKTHVLQVEDYSKWYNLYYLMPGNISTKELYLVSLTFGDIIDGIDHCYYPNSVIEFCCKNNLLIDGISYMAICKMLYEYMDFGDIKEYLPNSVDLYRTLQWDYNAKCNTFYLSKNDMGAIGGYYNE